MAHKTLIISEEALIRKKPLSEFAGILDDEQFEKATLEARRSGSIMHSDNHGIES